MLVRVVVHMGRVKSGGGRRGDVGKSGVGFVLTTLHVLCGMLLFIEESTLQG